MSARVQSLRFWIATVATALAAAATLALGQWQLNRASEKEALQAAIASQSSLAVVEGGALAEAKSQDQQVRLVHRTARLRGVWLAEHTVFLDNRQMDGKPGFFVLTPLQLDGLPLVVLVQRGWVQRNFVDRSQVPAVPTPQGLVTVEGRLAPWPSQLYEFEQETTGLIRQNLPVEVLAPRVAEPLFAGSLLQTQEQADGLKRNWAQPASTLAKHYGYAFQWFGLSALIAALYVWFQFVKRKSVG